MHPTVSILATLAFFISSAANAADANGYTAKNEKQIGTPPPCSIVISTVDDSNWDKLNDPSHQVICISPGDYTSKGVLTLTASGAANKTRWLRFHSSTGDSNLHPVRQTARATIKGLDFKNANNWTIHRISIDGKNASGVSGIMFRQHENAGSNNIFDSLLIENVGSAGIWIGRGSDANIVQNTVIREFQPTVDQERNCIHLADGPANTRIINNELYDCTKGVYFNEWNDARGTIVENNDMYMTPATYTDCNGTFAVSGSSENGVCSTGKTLISMKSGGVAGNPVRIVHNRLWGVRLNDTSICCTAESNGHAIGLGPVVVLGSGNAEASHVLIVNNIIFDAQNGVNWSRDVSTNNFLVGNLFYDINQFSWDPRRSTTTPSQAIMMLRGNNNKAYLNTIVDTGTWSHAGGAPTNNDVRCNVVLDGGKRTGGAVSPTTTVANNAFYGITTAYTSMNETPIGGDVTQSRMGQFCFMRKLLTNAERFCIRNALPRTDSPHKNACPVNLALP